MSVAFDTNHPDLIELGASVFSQLGIQWYAEPKSHNNCQMLGFSMPDSLLSEYGMLFSGDKFKAQPRPADQIVANINFAAGLFNSDGHFTRPKYGRGWLVFSNTVRSILDSLEDCLDEHGIHWREYSYDPKIDKRTGRMPKRGHQVHVFRQVDLERLRNMLTFTLKG